MRTATLMQTATQDSATQDRTGWPRRVDLSASGRSELLDRFQRELDSMERITPLRHSYERVDPYIVESEQAAHTYWMIIYNIESELWYAQNNWKDHSFEHLHKHDVIRSGDVIFDIGCNAGFTTCWYALSAGPQGKVYAFDPFPWNAIATRYNAELNDLRNVTVHQVGIGAVDERIKLSLYDSKITSRQAEHVIDAQIRPLSNYRKLRPNILKIDIEGAEYELSLTDFSNFVELRACVLELHPEFIEARGLLPHVCMENFARHGFEARRDIADPDSIYGASGDSMSHGHYYLTRSLPRAGRNAVAD